VSLSHVVRDDHPPWSPLQQQHHQPPSQQQEEARPPISVLINEEQQHRQLHHQHQLAQPLGHQLSSQPVQVIMQQQQNATVNPAEHRSSSITSMLSSKVAVQRLPPGVTRVDVESFLTRLNVSGLKSCQFDSHGTSAVLEFHMPQFAQECVMRVDAQRMRASDRDTLEVSLFEAAKLEPGNILIAERYEKDVSTSTVSALFRNIPNFKGTCKPYGASYCFAEFVDATSCASALNKAHATSSEVYFRYVSQSELSEFHSARQKEREEALSQFQAAETPDLRENVSSVPPSVSAHSSQHSTRLQRVVAVQQDLPPSTHYSPMHYTYTIDDAEMVFTPSQKAMSAFPGVSAHVAYETTHHSCPNPLPPSVSPTHLNPHSLMQPEPLTPRGLSLIGLSEEELALLLSNPESPAENSGA
jgi:hypothetical protein